jgi:hypothetical protein
VIGGATVTRAGGTLLQLRVGDSIFRGDTIETSAGGQTCIRFIDGTAFNLSNSARLALQEFPAEGSSQPALLNVGRGDFAFIAGEMAKAGRLAIDTPVASIRGRTQFGGIGTLSLVSLFFAAMEKVQAAPSNVAFTDDELIPIDYTSEPHGSFELVTKEAVPRHFFVADPGVTWSFRLSSSSELTVSQSANSPARMEQLHTIQQNVLHTFSVGLQAMQGPTFNGQNGSTTNPNFEILPGNARPINFQPDNNSGPSQFITTTSLEVANSNGGASKTSGATTSVSDSGATSPSLDSVFVPPAPPPAPPPSAPAAPVITTTVPAQDNASSIDIAGTAEALSTVTLSDNGSKVATTTADGSGNWSVKGIALSNGADYSFTATVTNAANSTSTSSNALVFHDSQSALSISIATIAGDNIVNATEAAAGFAINGTTTGVEDGQIATIQIVDNSNTVVDSFNATVTGNAWSVTVPSTDHLADGNYTVKADVSDKAGNSAPEATRSLTVDETAPAAPGVSLTSDTGASSSDNITDNPALTLTGVEAAAGTKVEYSLNGGTTWSTSAPTIAQLVQGANTIDVRQTDVAGNVSNVTAFTFTLDTVAPAVAITSPIAGDNIVNATEAAAGFAISGTTTGVEDGQIATIQIVDSANAVVDSFNATVTGNAWSVTVPSTDHLADGSYTVKADVSDKAGNPAIEATQTLTVNESTPSPIGSFWGSSALPQPPIPGTHFYGPFVNLNFGFGLGAVSYHYTSSNYNANGPDTITEGLATFDTFLLPFNGGNLNSIATSTFSAAPFPKSEVMLPSLTSTSFEGIDIYETPNANGGLDVNRVILTEGANPSSPLTAGSPTVIESGISGNQLIAATFANNSSGIMTSYEVAWDQYSNGVFSIDFQIFNPNNTTASSIVTVASPFASNNYPTYLSTPPWFFRAAGSGSAYGLAFAQTNPATGLDDIQFQGYNASGVATGLSFNIVPKLIAYASGATNQITEIANPPNHTGSGTALQFIANPGSNTGYSFAWSETVTDSIGTHEQVEFAISNQNSSTPVVTPTSHFDVSDGLPQNVKVNTFTLNGANYEVLAYGDATATHIVEFDSNGNQLVSITDPTSQQFSQLASFGDGRVALTYDDVLSDGVTSQEVTHVYDLRTTGITGTNFVSNGLNRDYAGTQFNDTVVGANGFNSTYYYVGRNNASGQGPSDSFTGGTSVSGVGGWNVAILPDARSNYLITTINGVTTLVNIGDPAHAGMLSVTNVQELVFNPAVDPSGNSGLLEAFPGSTLDILRLPPTVIEPAQIDSGATLEISNTASAPSQIAFAGSNATLQLDQTPSITGPLNAFFTGDAVDLPAFAMASAAIATSSTAANTTLVVTDATHTVANGTAAQITLNGNYTTSMFSLTNDGQGGVAIGVNAPALHGFPSSVQTSIGTPQVISAASGPVTDPNAGNNLLLVSLKVQHGTLGLAGSAANINISQNGSAGILSFTGTLAAINQALAAGATYTPTAGFSGADALSIAVNGQAVSDPFSAVGTVDISVAPTVLNTPSAAGTNSNTSTPAPMYELTGATITGAGGHGLNVATADTNATDTLTVQMDASSTISVSGSNSNGLNLSTNGASIYVNTAGPISASGTGGIGINAAVQSGDGSILVDALANLSGGKIGIQAVNNGSGSGSIDINVGPNETVTGTALYGIFAQNLGPGNTLVTTAVGDVINSASAGIHAVNSAASLPAASDSSVVVTAASGTINSGAVPTGNGFPAAGILAGYTGVNNTPDPNVVGNVVVDDFASITAATGTDGIRAFNYGVGPGTVSITAESSAVINAGRFGISGNGNSTVGITVASSGIVSGGTAGINVAPVSGGSLNGDVSIAVTGGTISSPTTAIQVNTSGSVTIENSGQIIHGTVAAPSVTGIAINETTGSIITIDNFNHIVGDVTLTNATFNNHSGAVWDVSGSNTFGAGTDTLNNDGTINVLASSSFTATGTLNVIGSGSFTIADGATLEFGGSVAATQTVNFSATTTTETLKIDHSLTAPFNGHISGLTGSPKDAIDLADLTYNGANTTAVYTSLTSSSGTLVVSDGNGHNETFNLINYTGSGIFTTSSDSSHGGTGGTWIVDPPAAQDLASGTFLFKDLDSADVQTVNVLPENGGAGYVGSFTVDAPNQSNGQEAVGWHFILDQTVIKQTATQTYDVTVTDARQDGTKSAVAQSVSITIGGSTNDAFVFKPGFGADTIVNAKSVDTIELDGFSSVTSLDQLQALLHEAQASQTQTLFQSANGGRDTVINLGNNDVITLANVQLVDLHANNFIIHT